MSPLISLPEFNLPLIGSFTWFTPPGPYRVNDLSGRKLISGSHTYFFDHTRTRRASLDEGSAQYRGHLRDKRTWKTIHTIHTPINSNKVNMKGWLWLPNDIRGPCEPIASWHLSYRWGKSPEKLHSGNLSRSGIEPGPTEWQARMLPPAPQRF